MFKYDPYPLLAALEAEARASEKPAPETKAALPRQPNNVVEIPRLDRNPPRLSVGGRPMTETGRIVSWDEWRNRPARPIGLR